MLSVDFSLSNLAEWTPTTTSSLGYFFSSRARSGSVWMQLMQQSVQKSSTTMRPRRSSRRRGDAVFSQAMPPSSDGAGLNLLLGFPPTVAALEVLRVLVKSGRENATNTATPSNSGQHRRERVGVEACEGRAVADIHLLRRGE